MKTLQNPQCHSAKKYWKIKFKKFQKISKIAIKKEEEKKKEEIKKKKKKMPQLPK